MTVCPHCGAQTTGAKFCTSCGALLSAETSAAWPPPPESAAPSVTGLPPADPVPEPQTVVPEPPAVVPEPPAVVPEPPAAVPGPSQPAGSVPVWQAPATASPKRAQLRRAVWIPIAAAVVVAALIVTFIVVRSQGSGSDSTASSALTTAPASSLDSDGFGAVATSSALSSMVASSEQDVESSSEEAAESSAESSEEEPAESSQEESVTGQDSPSSSDDASEEDSTSSATAAAGVPSWCMPGGEANAAAYDVFQPGTAASLLTSALAEAAEVPELADDANALSSAIAGETPAPTYASEALGRLLLLGSTDPQTVLDDLNKQSETACGTDVFSSDGYGNVLQSSPFHNSDDGSISDIYGAYGECGDQGTNSAGVITGLRAVLACGSKIMVTNLHTGALQEYPGVADGATQFNSDDDTIGWMTSVVTPASGLNPPVWTITADILDIAHGTVVTVKLTTPKVDGVLAQQGDVSLDAVGGHTFVATVMAGDNTYSTELSSVGKVISQFTTQDADSPALDHTGSVVGAFVSTNASTSTGSFFDGYTGAWSDPPGWDGSSDQRIVTDDGCGRVGLVLTRQSGNPDTFGPNSLYALVKGKVVRTAFPTFDWSQVDIVGLVPQGVVVRASDGSGKEFVELISAKNAAVVWRLGSDRVQPDSASVTLGVLTLQNNSDAQVLVDPATGKEAAGLSAAATSLVSNQHDYFTVADGATTDYLHLDGSSLWVLTPSDGVCK